MLAAFSRPQPDWIGILGLGAFITILLALTFMLKEETDDRLTPFHKVSMKPIGIVMLVLGLFGIYFGASYFMGAQPLPDGSGRCRLVCGWILLVTQSLGDTVGRYFAFTIWTAFGAFIAYGGYKALRG